MKKRAAIPQREQREIDLVWFGLAVVEELVARRHWGDAQHYARATREMIRKAERGPARRPARSFGKGGAI